MKNTHAFVLVAVMLLIGSLRGTDYPQAEISNGQIRATLNLPSAQKGYYRGTRFDWSGLIGNLGYESHTYSRQEPRRWQMNLGKGEERLDRRLLPNLPCAPQALRNLRDKALLRNSDNPSTWIR